MLGPYCQSFYPPSLQSKSNRLGIKYSSWLGGESKGFIAYYESLGPLPNDNIFMAASRRGTYYSGAIAFLMSSLVNIPEGGYCLSFSYYMRSNLRVKITTRKNTVTLANWVVDGGRSFHKAALSLPPGMYKIIWETVDGRKDFGEFGSPYHRYSVTMDEINILSHECLLIGRLMHDHLELKMRRRRNWPRWLAGVVYTGTHHRMRLSGHCVTAWSIRWPSARVL